MEPRGGRRTRFLSAPRSRVVLWRLGLPSSLNPWLCRIRGALLSRQPPLDRAHLRSPPRLTRSGSSWREAWILTPPCASPETPRMLVARPSSRPDRDPLLPHRTRAHPFYSY